MAPTAPTRGLARLALWLAIVIGVCVPHVWATSALRGAKAAAAAHRPLEPQDINAPGGMMPWAQLGFHPRGFPNSGPLPAYSPALLRRVIPQYTRLQLPLGDGSMPPTPYQLHHANAIRQLSFGAEVLPDKHTPFQLSLLRSGVEGGIPRSYPAEFVEVAASHSRLRGRRTAVAATSTSTSTAHGQQQFPSLGGLTAGLQAAASAAVSTALSMLPPMPKARKGPGEGDVPPLGDRPPPPAMKEPPATNRGTTKDPAPLAVKFRFDHQELFGPVEDEERRPPAPFPPTRFKPIPMAGSGAGVGSDSVAAKVPQPLMPMVWRQRPDTMPWATAVPTGDTPNMVQTRVASLKSQDKSGPFDEVYAQ